MLIAYFTNRYPATSHTFIRREILALEARGHTVLRFALRHAEEKFEDKEDIRELERTRHVLRLGKASLVLDALLAIVRNPLKAVSTLFSALRFSAASRRGTLRHLAYWIEALVIAHWCQRSKVDHIHVHFGTNAAAVGALVGQITGIPFSITIHGSEEFDRPEELSLGKKIAKAAFVVAISSFGRSQLMRWAKLEDWSKIHIVHCGLDETYLQQPDTGLPGEPKLLCVARLTEQKGLLTLLHAASTLRKRGIRFNLTLVGDGPLRGVIETEIRKQGLGDFVELAGWMGQPEIMEQIRQSRAMVLPSFAEGLPVVLMESMALRRPVISTYVAGIPELVNESNGWLIPAGDAVALDKAMEAALTADADRMRQLGENARNAVVKRHDISVSACLIERLILRAKPEPHAVASAAGAGRTPALDAVT